MNNLETQMFPTAKITSKGRITIPKNIRKILNLKPGDKVEFLIKDKDVVHLVPIIKNGASELPI